MEALQLAIKHTRAAKGACDGASQWVGERLAPVSLRARIRINRVCLVALACDSLEARFIGLDFARIAYGDLLFFVVAGLYGECECGRGGECQRAGFGAVGYGDDGDLAGRVFGVG